MSYVIEDFVMGRSLVQKGAQKYLKKTHNPVKREALGGTNA
jgi:hypothetical protein